MDDLLSKDEINLNQSDFGKITAKEKFTAAKQILLGCAILYVLTLGSYLYKPDSNILDICKQSFPLVTLILGAYFGNKAS